MIRSIWYHVMGYNPQPQPDEVTLEAPEDEDASWRDEDEEIGYSDGVPVDDMP